MTIALLHGRAWGRILIPYPGLSKLIKQSEFIVVANIVGQPFNDTYGLGGGAVHKIRVLAVLKGGIKPEHETTAYLWSAISLHYGGIEGENKVLQKRPTEGDRYVLFLNKADPTNKHSEYQGRGCSGEWFWIPPTSNPLKLKGKSVRGNIGVLLNDVLVYEKGRRPGAEQIRELEHFISIYTGGP